MKVPDLPTAAVFHPDPAGAATHAVILAYHQAWKSRDLDALMALYDPAIDYHDKLQNRHITYHQLRDYLAASMPLGAEELQTYTERLLIDGDTAVLQYQVTLNGSDGLVSLSTIEALSVRQGLIFKVNEYAVLVSNATVKPAEREGNDAISRLGLSARQVGALANDLNEYFQQSKPYLNPALDLPQVAAATGYTRNQISFFLNQVRGQSFYAFLNDLRLSEVLERLHASEAPSRIDELAQAAGFNSLSTFYRCFKQHTGVTPKQYVSQRTR
ncbi:helix-turn-helix domain-containing protein [Pseudomonas turukhanskensis]|uniref:Transcriptional regulator n=1 Tax=Pseudomonas turukhanskensis TaxID=1806536 RepID=A0A9W6NGX8_9PSED|nr:helix-turn-helix domain-containing protein [Pseudomonas turukhanskensis]GLK90176.1 transcriptional regulator [Pseudomonas turukhanskensis]